MLPTTFESDHEAFRESVRTFMRRVVLPSIEDYATEKGHPRSLWLAAGEQGYLGHEIPEQYGGSAAADYRYNAVLIDGLARVNLALASSLSIHFDVVTPYLVEQTTEEQRKQWLPGVASGEIVTAIGMTEPSAGSDLAALRTRAGRRDRGWVLNADAVPLDLVRPLAVPGRRRQRRRRG